MLLRETRQTKRQAFTLMEIIAVVTIILILAGAGIFVVTGVIDKSREDRAKMDVMSIEKAVMVYQVRHGFFPQSLDVLVQLDEGNTALLEPNALIDPFGQHFQYEPQTLHPTTRKPLIYSNGSPQNPKRIANWAQ